MSNPLIAKLGRGARLMDEDQPILKKLTAKTQRVNTHQDMIHEDGEPDNVYLIMESFACRCQILPGDLYCWTYGATASALTCACAGGGAGAHPSDRYE
jgi:hypothetical protein